MCRFDEGDFALSWTDFGLLLIIGIGLLVKLERERQQRRVPRELHLIEHIFIAFRWIHALFGHLLAAIMGIIHQYYTSSTATVLTHLTLTIYIALWGVHTLLEMPAHRFKEIKEEQMRNRIAMAPVMPPPP